MKKIAFLTIVASSLFTINSFAQQFVNGSFEPMASVIKCAYRSTANFNIYMGGVMATGSDTGVYVSDNSCGYGAPAHGMYYAGTRYLPMKGANYFVLKLNAPMLAGKTYKFSFSYKAIDTATALIPLMGYSNDSVSHTTYVHALPAPKSTSWVKLNDSITPTVASSYIWIAGSSTGAEGAVFFDNFVMETQGSGGGGASVSQLSIDNLLEIYPNPVTDAAHIKFHEGIKYPVAVTLYDITGKEVFNEKNINRNIVIQRAGLTQGMYLLKLTDAEGASSMKKLMVE